MGEGRSDLIAMKGVDVWTHTSEITNQSVEGRSERVKKKKKTVGRKRGV